VLKQYKSIDGNNLFAFTYERSISLCQNSGHIGFIIPVASVCTDRYSGLQDIWLNSGNLVISSFNDRPGKLFDGLEHIRLSIVLLSKTSRNVRTMYLSQYNKWNTIARPCIFYNLGYSECSKFVSSGSMPKTGSTISKSILLKLTNYRKTIANFSTKLGKYQVLYTRKLSGFVQIIDFIPAIHDAHEKKRVPSELKDVLFDDALHSVTILASLNSSLFYWFLTIWSDCRNLNKREVLGFPICESVVHDNGLAELAKKLMSDLQVKSQILQMNNLKINAINLRPAYSFDNVVF
jgi:hypothetical protein